jgi:hypothetical protein
MRGYKAIPPISKTPIRMGAWPFKPERDRQEYIERQESSR